MLPARVRISLLPALPQAQMFQTLSRLDPSQSAVLREPSATIAVALAGGSAIGWAAALADQTVLVLSPAWRGKGIEEALLTATQPTKTL